MSRVLAWPTLALSDGSAAPITTAALDVTIARYLPASLFELRGIIADRTADDAAAARISTVAAALVMLADFDHNHDDDPTRAY